MVCEHLIWYAQPLLEQGRPRKSWPNTWAGPRRTSAGGLKNNSLTFDELSKALHFAGYEVSMSDANGAGLPELGNSTSPP